MLKLIRMGIVTRIVLPLFRSFNRRVFKTNWKDFRNTQPFSEVFGKDRGTPIDRYYIEKFLENNSSLISKTVIEIGDNYYTQKFGQTVVKSEVLHFTPGNPLATIIGDLCKKETLPEAVADCFVCTQTLNFIYDFRAAIEGAYYMLKENGVALFTVAGISQISRYDMDRWGDYWRFTSKSAQKIFSEVFGEENVSVQNFGNVLTSIAFLEGIASEELKSEELLYTDNNYQMLITVIASKKYSRKI